MELDNSSQVDAPQLFTIDQTAPEEVRALHHSAFESLRQSTLSDEEAFLARMRCWEAAAEASSSPTGVPSGALAPPGSPNVLGTAAGASPPSIMSAFSEDHKGAAALADVNDGFQNASDDEDEVELILDGGSGPQPIPLQSGRSPVPIRPRVEIEELSRRLRAGMGLACYEPVRQWQSRASEPSFFDGSP